MDDRIAQITNALERIQDNYQDNELAYLSLTSKNEGLIRDSFCRNYYKENQLLGREYKRIDAVSFSEESINIIFEFTSMYTADLVKDLHFKNSYLPKILNDFKKNDKLKSKKTDEYIILISTHPKEMINKKYIKYVKYFSGLNAATKKWIKTPTDSSKMISQSYNNLRKYFSYNEYSIESCQINAGREFECDVDIHFWILYKKYCVCDYEQVADILLENQHCSNCGGFL
ncbi:hypothetical protein [Psychrobacillus antarcticus]|uniref:hypothetical protein n=1 Tax=Psychrobacillus antarcticus TaxID=2879115 RepID=UPI002407E41E|nr:hypothetical protein [Psychrobacillus antarcticus]